MFRTLSYLLVIFSISAAALEGRLLKTDKDVVVPRILADEIEKNYIQIVRDEDPKDIRTDLQLTMEIPRQLLSLELEFEKKNGRALDEDLSFKIPAGGAKIDLAPYLREGRGLFSMKLQIGDELAEGDLSRLKVYYIPRYQRLIQGNDVRGLGCETFADVTKFFKAEIMGQGLLLTTTNQAYFPVIAGSYILVVTHSTGIKIASMSLMDSRFKNFLCPVKPGR